MVQSQVNLKFTITSCHEITAMIYKKRNSFPSYSGHLCYALHIHLEN